MRYFKPGHRNYHKRAERKRENEALAMILKTNATNFLTAYLKAGATARDIEGFYVTCQPEKISTGLGNAEGYRVNVVTRFLSHGQFKSAWFTCRFTGTKAGWVTVNVWHLTKSEQVLLAGWMERAAKYAFASNDDDDVPWENSDNF